MTANQFLEKEFEKRKNKNPRYSLRAFARDLQIPAGRLSELLNSKRKLTKGHAQKIAEKLNLSPQEHSQLFISQKSDQPEYDVLAEDKFKLISDWYYFAILSFMETQKFRGSSLQIAKGLGLDLLVTKLALKRLKRLKFVELKNGKWVNKSGDLATVTDVPSSAIRKSHLQKLEKAAQVLCAIPVELRDFTSMTMAIDPKRLPAAKKMILNFRRKLCRFLESGNQIQVYELGIQLYPLTKGEKRK